MNGYTSFAEYPSTSWNYGSGATNASEVFAPTALAGEAIESIYAQDLVKRCTDVVFAVLGIVLTLPLWVLIALAVKLTSRGPMLFVQERAGLYGRPFRMFKFRSMVVDAEERLKDSCDNRGSGGAGLQAQG